MLDHRHISSSHRLHKAVLWGLFIVAMNLFQPSHLYAQQQQMLPPTYPSTGSNSVGVPCQPGQNQILVYSGVSTNSANPSPSAINCMGSYNNGNYTNYGPYLTTYGGVGIGTAKPSSLLGIYGGGLAVGSYAATKTAANGSIMASGQVTIGTSVVANTLDVNGGVAIGTYAGTVAAPANSLIASGSLFVGTPSSLHRFEVDDPNGYGYTSKLLFATESNVGSPGAAVLRVNSSDPSKVAALDVGNGTQDWQFRIYNNSSNYLIIDDATRIAARMVFDLAGNVGIGTDAPQATLDVAGGVRVGNSAAVVCSPANEGTLAYGYAAHVMQYCNGAMWKNL